METRPTFDNLEEELRTAEPMTIEAFIEISESSIDSTFLQDLALTAERDGIEETSVPFQNLEELPKSDDLNDPGLTTTDKPTVVLDLDRESRFQRELVTNEMNEKSLQGGPFLSDAFEQVVEMLLKMKDEKERTDQELGRRYMETKTRNHSFESQEFTFRYPMTEFEEWKRVFELWGEEQLFDMWETLPDQMTSSLPKKFVDGSRRVADPKAEALQDFETRPWSPGEIEIFMEKFAQYPKDFYEIAKWLPRRSTGDCVQFFYAHKKKDLFGSIRRKHQLKKRRLQSESNREALTTYPLSYRKRQQNEQKRQHDLKTWILEKIKFDAIPFSEAQLLEAVHQKGFNYKALARELQCEKASVVGAYLLLNWQKLGLDVFFQSSSKSTFPFWLEKIKLSEKFLQNLNFETLPFTSNETQQIPNSNLVEHRTKLTLFESDSNSKRKRHDLPATMHEVDLLTPVSTSFTQDQDSEATETPTTSFREPTVRKRRYED